MRFASLLVTVLILAGLVPGGSTGVAANRPVGPQILLLNSHHEGYRGTDDIVAGFRGRVRELIPDAVIKTEYLDGKHHSGERYDGLLSDLLRCKYAGSRFDLLFASDDYAFNFLENHYASLFEGTPVVFAGTNDFDRARIAGRRDFIGINELPSFDKTVELIRQLLPGTRHLVALYDNGLTGRLNSATFRKQVPAENDDIEVHYLEADDLESVVDGLNALTADTAIV
jgi:hypothetical protein